jgi:hypothetical protein
MIPNMAVTAADRAAVASGGVAIGTLAFACAMWRLASTTREMAKALTNAVAILSAS